MTALSFEVSEWLGGTEGPEDLTFGSLRIQARDLGISLTEVHDTIAQATRDTIRVPSIRVAKWLLSHWWRLRWEPRPDPVTFDWRRAHSMAALGGGFAWPPLEVTSDGEFVQLSVTVERARDAAAVRYLNDVTAEVPARDFETAVSSFLDTIEGRLGDATEAARELRELRSELTSERTDPELSRRCRWEARAGFEAGDSPEGWFEALDQLASDAGETSMEDMLSIGRDPMTVRAAVDALKAAPTTVRLGGIPRVAPPADDERPWARGVAAAKIVRDSLGLTSGPLDNATLSDLLSCQIPVEKDVSTTNILGAYRPNDPSSRAHVVVGSARPTTQRFYFARLLGMAGLLGPDEQVIPITAASTAPQKLNRAFAQELLCPWADLDAFTRVNGTGHSAVAEFAETYDVAEMVVVTTLVNRGRIDRSRLFAYAV